MSSMVCKLMTKFLKICFLRGEEEEKGIEKKGGDRRGGLGEKEKEQEEEKMHKEITKWEDR